MESEERTTEELILTLAEDYRRCYKAVLDAIENGKRDDLGNTEVDDQFQCRQFIRALFAYIEGVTFALKLAGLDGCMSNNVNLSAAHVDMTFEVRHEIDDKGQIVQRPNQITLSKNIKFAFALYAKAHNIENPLDTSLEWWSCFKSSTRVRNRLTHPRNPEDLDVQPFEIVDAVKAEVGYSKTLKSLLGAAT